MISTVQTAISNTEWQNSDGILDFGGKELLVRALARVYELNPNNAELRNYIASFISVQVKSSLKRER